MSSSILEIALKLERREKPRPILAYPGSNIRKIIESRPAQPSPANQPDTVGGGGGGGYRLTKQNTNCWLLEHNMVHCYKINVGNVSKTNGEHFCRK